MTKAISVSALTKKYGEIDAVRGIAFEVAAGETFGPARDWPWRADARGRTCAYVSLDATGVGLQGPHGAAAEGRMAYVGLIFSPGAAGEPARERALSPKRLWRTLRQRPRRL